MFRLYLSSILWLLCWFFVKPADAIPLADIKWQDNALQSCVESHGNWENSEQFTKLKCHNKKIASANELKHFTSLENLSLFGNRLTTLDIRELTKLTALNLANNRLTQLEIAGLEHLDTLFLFKNQLQRLDLSGLHRLKKIRIMQNKLISLDITPLVSLETGYFFDNQLEDLQIDGLEKLTFLDVKQNPMPDELYDFYDQQKGIVISHDGNADDWN